MAESPREALLPTAARCHCCTRPQAAGAELFAFVALPTLLFMYFDVLFPKPHRLDWHGEGLVWAHSVCTVASPTNALSDPLVTAIETDLIFSKEQGARRHAPPWHIEAA